MTGITTNTRYHDFSAGHRVVGHEGKCKWLHGHNYRIHFTCQAPSLDGVGRVIDFSVIKEKLCDWLEGWWDHKLILWDQDPIKATLCKMETEGIYQGVITVPFNPTAENIAKYLVEVIGPLVLKHTGVTLVSCTVDETRKCSATFTKTPEVFSLNLTTTDLNAVPSKL